MQQSFLGYRRFYFLKLALAVVIVAAIAYAAHVPVGPPNGGTWLGYGLGGLCAALILWLTFFGIRKRRYGPGQVRLQAWLSAHVYLGLSLLILATLHTGFQFGVNIHTLAYVLMVVVILSGAFGVYAYVRYPKEMTENRGAMTLGDMMLQIADLDEHCRETAVTLSDEINAAVLRACQNTRVGGGLLRQLSGRDPSCPSMRALGEVEKLAPAASGEQTTQVRRLMSLLTRKCELLKRARQDVRFQALIKVWLFLHIPLSVALVAALAAHIFSVFFYW